MLGPERTVPIRTSLPDHPIVQPDGTGAYPVNRTATEVRTSDQPRPDETLVRRLTNDQETLERVRGHESPIVGGYVHQDLDAYVMDGVRPAYRSGFDVRTNFGITPRSPGAAASNNNVQWGTSNRPGSGVPQHAPTGTRVGEATHGRLRGFVLPSASPRVPATGSERR